MFTLYNVGKSSKTKSANRKKMYGAYELKTKYQSGMLLGTLCSALMAVLVSSYMVHGTPVERRPVVEKTCDSIIVSIRTYDRSKSRPPKPNDARKQKLEKILGTPLPIPDDDLFDEPPGIATRNERKEYNLSDFDFGEYGDDQEIVYQPPDNESGYPPIDKWVAVEVRPQMIIMARPRYPRMARRNSIEATVWIKALVDKNGDVVEAVIFVSSKSNYGFDEAARKAALKCKFSPAVQNGYHVAVWVSFAVEFRLND